MLQLLSILKLFGNWFLRNLNNYSILCFISKRTTPSIMFKIISESQSKVVAVKIGAAVTKEDYDLALPQIEDKIKTHGKINLYCEMDKISTIEPEAVFKDLKFDLKHLNDFNKVAIVGEKDWEKWMTRLGSVFTSAEVHYYSPTDKANAMDWVSN